MTSESRKRVKYVGPSLAVDVNLPDGGVAYHCEQGKSISVPSSVAKSLLKQSCWEEGTGVKASDEDAIDNEPTKGKK